MKKINLLTLIFLSATTIFKAQNSNEMISKIKYYLVIEGLQTDPKDKGQIEIESWSWGVSNYEKSNYDGEGKELPKTREVTNQEVYFTIKMSALSPVLYEKCKKADTYKKITLMGKRVTANEETVTNKEILKVVFSDCFVASYNTGGSGYGSEPTDQLSIRFSKMDFEYLNK